MIYALIFALLVTNMIVVCLLAKHLDEKFKDTRDLINELAYQVRYKIKQGS